MIKRDIDEKFKKISETRKVVLITGARQVGKSTFVKSIKESDREYITLKVWTHEKCFGIFSGKNINIRNV